MSMKLLVLLVGCLQIWARSLPPHELLATAYATNFSVIDSAMWVTDTSCFSCKAPKDPKTAECTNNTVTALRPGSIANGAGLTIVTTRQANAGACTPAPAGGTSGHLSSRLPVTFVSSHGTFQVVQRRSAQPKASSDSKIRNQERSQSQCTVLEASHLVRQPMSIGHSTCKVAATSTAATTTRPSATWAPL